MAARRYPELPESIQPSLCREELEQLLGWLAPRFHFLTPRRLLGLLDGSLPPADRPGVLLTFDDGLANNWEQAVPVLEAFDAPAVFFVATAPVASSGDPDARLPSAREAARDLPRDVAPEVCHDLFDSMDETQLRRAGAHPLLTLGAHSRRHPRLPDLSRDALVDEVAGSKAWLEERLDTEVELFAYPYGAYDRSVLEAVRAAGFRAAFAEDSRGLGIRAFEIPRVGLYRAGRGYLALKLSGWHRPALPAGWLARAEEAS